LKNKSKGKSNGNATSACFLYIKY